MESPIPDFVLRHRLREEKIFTKFLHASALWFAIILTVGLLPTYFANTQKAKAARKKYNLPRLRLEYFSIEDPAGKNLIFKIKNVT